MAQLLKFTNNAWGTLAAGIAAGDLTLSVTAGQGARFPALAAGEFFYATLSTSANVLEVIKVTARATDAFTIVRAQDNTAASAFLITDRIELRPCAAAFDAMAQSASPTFSGTITTPLTASRAVATGASSELAASATTATELGYVNGVTSAIQTQMDLKAPLASPTFTGTVNLPANTRLAHMTASRAVYADTNKDLQPANTTITELNYVNGVTSAIQTQIDAKYGSGSSPSFAAVAVGGALTGATTGAFSGAVSTGALTVTGAITATGEITAYFSDNRLKDRIAPITNATPKLNSLDVFTYRQNQLANALVGPDARIKVGVSAQQIQEVQPEAVAPAPFDRAEDGSSESGENYLTVQYDKLVPLLIAGFQEQSAELARLRLEIKALRTPKSTGPV